MWSGVEGEALLLTNAFDHWGPAVQRLPHMREETGERVVCVCVTVCV